MLKGLVLTDFYFKKWPFIHTDRVVDRQTDWLTPRKLTEVICFATGFNKWQEIVWDAVPSSNIKMEEKINGEPELSGWTISGTGE